MADPKRILVAGDWHGNSSWAFGVIRRLPELLPEEQSRIIIHCGDFGIWPGPGGRSYLRSLDRYLASVDAVLWFVDGNHDDHDQLARLPETGTGLGWVSDRVVHIPRGHRWTWHGRTWLGLGGAVSVDKALRTEGKDWWAGEVVSWAEAQKVIDEGPADVMVTHDAPSLTPLRLPPVQPAWAWAPEDLVRADKHRALLQTVVDAVEPRWLMHGHYHLDSAAQVVEMPHGPVEVAGFNCDGSARRNWAVLNTETMEWGTSHA